MLSLHRSFNRQTMVELLRLALPMVVSQGTFAVMIFTDRYFMSQIDPAHMAAALGGGVASFFSFCFFVGLFSYANALAAQYLGAGEQEKCPKVVTQGMIMTVMSAPFLTLITFLVAGIFEGMGHEPAQVELERTYYLILMSGVLVTLAKTCLSSYFAGIGRTHVVMIVSGARDRRCRCLHRGRHGPCVRAFCRVLLSQGASGDVRCTALLLARPEDPATLLAARFSIRTGAVPERGGI
jgi:Na+-driven multidrug efflux pump